MLLNDLCLTPSLRRRKQFFLLQANTQESRVTSVLLKLFVRKFFFLTLEASDSSFEYFESRNMFSEKSPLRALQNC